MAYFNHAFLKCFNPTSVAVGGEKTSELTPGQIALVQDGTWEQNPLPPGGYLGYIVQGSYHTVDSIGNNPGHGGYTESVKSKGINPRFISRLYSTECIAAEKSTSAITVGPKCVPCGESLYLRFDVKGSPALRFLNHNAYAIGDSANVCCVDGQTYIDPAAALAEAGSQLLADPLISPFVRERQWGAVAAGVEITQASGLSGVDSTSTVGAGGANYTIGDIVSVDTGTSLAVVEVTTVAGGAVTGFVVLASGSGYSAATVATTNIEVANAAAAGFTVTVVLDTDLETYSIAQVADGTYTPSTDPVGDAVSATLHVEGAYTETKFGNCSFDTRDFYGKEPVQIIASVLDETGDPCSDCGTVVNTPGTMASTIGETVLRDILMTESYMQSPYNQGNVDSSRIREIEGSDDILASVDRTALYKTYVIQHTVPRFNNPTGVFDNDQYLYKIYVKCDDAETIAAIETLMAQIQEWANKSGNQVQYVEGIDA
jgi:hypothetical protein